MLENFQLAAIVKTGEGMRLFRIPLHQNLQTTLSERWEQQYTEFLSNITEVQFDAGYNLEKHERFRLSDYQLPDWLRSETSLTIHNQDSISANDHFIDSIRSVVAFARNEQKQEVVLFQKFIRSHVIKPGNSLFLQDDTYKSVQRPGLTLETKLSALYFTTHAKLLFHTFRTANSFLPLTDFYEEASEQDIREVLGHARLAAEDPDALAVGASQWFCKRFALLKNSKILDKFTAKEIKAHSKGYDVDVQVKGNKIVFPAEKEAAKRLLQFLNEELFRGPITETLYEMNSKREAD
ncbi:MAG TPA: hypothetical protein VN666_20495 [Nitrospira sp.]|nr:hypothetical protein [Nitrospira sp.]